MNRGLLIYWDNHVWWCRRVTDKHCLIWLICDLWISIFDLLWFANTYDYIIDWWCYYCSCCPIDLWSIECQPWDWCMAVFWKDEWISTDRFLKKHWRPWNTEGFPVNFSLNPVHRKIMQLSLQPTTMGHHRMCMASWASWLGFLRYAPNADQMVFPSEILLDWMLTIGYSANCFVFEADIAKNKLLPVCNFAIPIHLCISLQEHDRSCFVGL